MRISAIPVTLLRLKRYDEFINPPALKLIVYQAYKAGTPVKEYWSAVIESLKEPPKKGST
jgi:hypothetical protein